MSGVYPRGGGGGEERRELVVGGRGGSCLAFYHVPQQCRREKLRYPNGADERRPWTPHTVPPPPSLFHCDTTPLSAATATATASFVSPSSSLVLNPSCNGTPYYPSITPAHLLDHHPLFGGSHAAQSQGACLSLSSDASPSHHDDQCHHGPAMRAPDLAEYLPPAWTAPRIGPVPIGPFTGYATILQGSRFLRPAQQVLEEVCGGGSTMVGAILCSGGEVEPFDLAADGVVECGENVDGLIGDGEHRKMKARLISMLDEVCKRYKQYYQQIQAVITSFEAVAGLNTAAPYTPMALKSLSKHFRHLKSAITDQLRFTNKAFGKEDQSKDDMPGPRVMNANLGYQRFPCSPAVSTRQPVWRPQRGLPEHAVTVLKAWLFEHFLHPYPTDMDKQMLAKQTGLSRNQVSNWFINARVRLWKPMVEEIHSLEILQVHNVAKKDSNQDTNAQPDLSSAYAVSPNNNQVPPSVISQKILDHSHKWFRDEFSQLPNHTKGPLNFSPDDLSTHHRISAPMDFTSTAANGGISLTLGLHQDDSICLSEPLPLNIGHRFGLEESTGAYVMDGFEGQDRHFGRDFEGQFLRHFVG